MRSKGLFTSAVAMALLGVGVANAQGVAATDSIPMDSVVVAAAQATPVVVSTTVPADQLEQKVWSAIRATEGYDNIPSDALLPITRDQAEVLITQLILEARKPYVEAAYRDSVLHSFKVETLKRRALDQALARTYTEPYERRLDQMERLLYALLLSKGDIDPAIIQQLLPTAGQPMGNHYLVPGQQQLVPSGNANNGVVTDTVLVNKLTPSAAADHSGKEVTPEEAIALKPGLNNKEIKLYMSVAYFGFDSSKVDSETAETLDNVVAWMKENDLRISLRGYASPEGRMSYNNKLSARRVNAVADYIVGKGIPRNRLEVIPSGIDSMKDTKSKYPQGRRVEIRPILY